MRILYFADHVGTFSCPFSSVYYCQLAPLPVHNRTIVGSDQALFSSSKEKQFRGCTTDTLHKDPDTDQQEFYCVLVEELIENNMRRRRGTRRSQRDPQNMRSTSHDTMNLIPELRATRVKKMTQKWYHDKVL